MNTYKKMHRVNAIMKKRLEEEGYSEIWMFPHTMWSKDVFNLWDAVCKRYSTDNKFTLYWLQFKTNYATGESKKEMQKFCEQSGQKGILVEYLARMVKNKSKKGSHEVGEVVMTHFPAES